MKIRFYFLFFCFWIRRWNLFTWSYFFQILLNIQLVLNKFFSAWALAFYGSFDWWICFRYESRHFSVMELVNWRFEMKKNKTKISIKNCWNKIGVNWLSFGKLFLQIGDLPTWLDFFYTHWLYFYLIFVA